MTEQDAEADRDELFDEDGWSQLADDPELAGRVARALEGLVPDILKRTLIASVNNVGSAVTSEEGLRAMLSDKKLPKETLNFLVGQADTMRREILRIISREIRIFLENMDFGGEIAKILTTLSFEIKTEIRFVPNDAALRPEMRNRVSVKRAKNSDDPADEAESPAAPPKAPPAPAPTEAPPAAPGHVPGVATITSPASAGARDEERDEEERGEGDDSTVRKNFKRGIRWARRKKDEVLEPRESVRMRDYDSSPEPDAPPPLPDEERED